jgi:hypothetical protein
MPGDWVSQPLSTFSSPAEHVRGHVSLLRWGECAGQGADAGPTQDRHWQATEDRAGRGRGISSAAGPLRP